jgi:hypothetical protein
MVRVKKTLLIIAAAVLVLCCAGGAVLYAIGSNADTYADPPNPCETPEVNRFGKIVDQQPREYGCVFTLDSDGVHRTLTVTATTNQAESRYEAAHHCTGATADVDGPWEKAFDCATGKDLPSYVVAFLDDNLFLSLELNGTGNVRSILIAMAKDLLKRLRDGGDHHHDFFDD